MVSAEVVRFNLPIALFSKLQSLFSQFITIHLLGNISHHLFCLYSIRTCMVHLMIYCVVFRLTVPLRDYTKIEEQNCHLVTHYGGKEFDYPRITTGQNDEIVIADTCNEEVIIFDKDLKLIRTFGQGSGDSKLNYPSGVAVANNVIAVSEWHDHVVKKYSLQGDYLSKLGSHGSGDGQFNRPQGLCFNSKGLLYVVDCSNQRVQVFSENNVFLIKFGSKGLNPGQFQCPRYVAVDSSDQVYVTDCDDGGIRVFSEDGHFIKKINCNKPFAISITPDDYIITHDDNNNVLTIFSPTHELIAKFGVHGKEKGQFNAIQGIAINNSGTIFVTEYGNHRLQIITSQEH